MTRQPERLKTTATLTVCGGLAFWAANLLISLTPIAADYRASQSIVYASMLVEALVGGLVIGLFVAYSLVRFRDSIPTRSSLSKSLVLSLLALAVVTVVIEIPAKFGSDTTDAVHDFVVATAFNVVRILALGVAVGLVDTRLAHRALQR